LRPGVAATLGRAGEYREWWEHNNEAALVGSGPLWVALGDSTAQGIGASAPDRGYVGQLLTLLRERSGRPWRVVNLSVAGARVADVLRVQVPRLRELAGECELVTCAAGANDLLRLRFGRVPAALEELISSLPPGSAIATIPQGLSRPRTRLLNEVVHQRAPAAGLRVADVWARTGPPWRGMFAPDDFHPNDAGYAAWCAAFADAVGLDAPR